MPVPHLVPVDDDQDAPADPVVRALLVTDQVASTRMIERQGDDRAYQIATRHDREARDLLPRFNGLEIDKTDGFLLLFERPIDAVAYALAYHRTLSDLSQELGVELEARAGIHLGEVILRENSARDVARGAKRLEVEGLAKPTAARVMGLARGGQTLLTRSAFDLARRSAIGKELSSRKVSWLAHGSYRFKGVEEPLEIFEVGAAGIAPLAVPPDTAKAHRVVTADDELTLGWRPAPDLAVPQRPHWILRQRLGIGGFGEVWLAEHEKTGEKRVFKFCLDARRLRSLKREITLFRLLKESLGQRDDIARVLDCNFDEAPYFLESEYTEGGSLVDWAEEQGGLAAVPLDTRLELVAQVADALAAAHSVGVLHKDVKPANVLVKSDRDGRPRAQLTDFGIGRVIDETVLSDHGITVLGMTEVLPPGEEALTGGTYLYMAPEVIEGKVGTVQADVYALGIMLYQVVVGDFSHPLSPGWRRDVPDEILAGDIGRMVDGSPERRPAGAGEVAEGLRRIEERRAEAEVERARERALRHRKIFASIGAVTSAVLLVVSVLAIQAMRARHQAELRQAQAEDLISFMLGDLQEKLDALGRIDILSEVGDKAREYFAAVPEGNLTDGEILRLSDALVQLGRLRIAEGSPDAAMEAFEQSLALSEKLAARDPENTEWQTALASRHFWLGNVLWSRGDHDSALSRWRRQLSIAQELVARHPEHPELQLQVAYASSNIGFAQQAQGNLTAALEAYQRSLTVKQASLKLEPEYPHQRQLDLAAEHNLVGSIQFHLGLWDEAAKHLSADNELAREMLHRDPSNTRWKLRLAISYNFLGRLAAAQGEYRQAQRHFQEGLSATEDLIRIDSTRTDWLREHAVAHRRIALHLLETGDPVSALRHGERADEIWAELSGKDPTRTQWQRDLALSRSSVGRILEAMGDLEAAEARARSSVSLLRTLVNQNASDRQSRRELAESYLILGRIERAQGRSDEAEKSTIEALQVIEPLARTSKDVHFLHTWSQALHYGGREDQASALLKELRARGVEGYL